MTAIKAISKIREHSSALGPVHKVNTNQDIICMQPIDYQGIITCKPTNLLQKFMQTSTVKAATLQMVVLNNVIQIPETVLTSEHITKAIEEVAAFGYQKACFQLLIQAKIIQKNSNGSLSFCSQWVKNFSMIIGKDIVETLNDTKEIVPWLQMQIYSAFLRNYKLDCGFLSLPEGVFDGVDIPDDYQLPFTNCNRKYRFIKDLEEFLPKQKRVRKRKATTANATDNGAGLDNQAPPTKVMKLNPSSDSQDENLECTSPKRSDTDVTYSSSSSSDDSQENIVTQHRPFNQRRRYTSSPSTIANRRYAIKKNRKGRRSK